MRFPTPPGLLLPIALLATILGACEVEPDDWAGRFEGPFEGTYVARTQLSADRGNLMTSRFSGTAWAEIDPQGEQELAIHVVDCDTRWRVTGDTATLLAPASAEGCLLDVAGNTGVLEVTLRSGTATLNDDALALTLEADGPPAPGATDPSRLTFTFEGTR